MGIGYNDSIILYNRHDRKRTNEEYFYGTRFDGVRVELTQGANIRQSGLETADSCLVKIPNGVFPKPYLPPKEWAALSTEERLKSFTVNPENKEFLVVVKKDELGLDISTLPVGIINSKAPEYVEVGGWFAHVKNKYSNVYAIHTFDVYSLKPLQRFEIGGS